MVETARITVVPKHAWIHKRKDARGKLIPIYQMAIKLPKQTVIRKSTGYSDENEARAICLNEYHKLRAKLSQNLPIRTATFQQIGKSYLQDYLEQVERGEASKGRYIEAEAILRNYVFPVLGKINVDAIDKSEIDKWKAERNKMGVLRHGKVKLVEPSVYTRNENARVIRRVLEFAWRQGYINSVPKFTFAKGKSRREAWNEVDWKRMIDCFNRELSELPIKSQLYKSRLQLKTYVQTVSYSGIRPGKELRNLRWSDIKIGVALDGGFREFPVSESEIPEYDKEAVGYVAIEVAYPKLEKQARKAYGIKHLERALRAWRKVTDFPAETDLVFCHQLSTTSGEPGAPVLTFGLPFNAFLDRNDLRGETGIPKTLYSIRHTFISLRLKEGVGIHSLAKNAGTSVRQIDSRYSHLVTSDVIEELVKLRSHT